MMPKFAKVRWESYLTKAKCGFAFGVEYISTIDTGLALWDTCEFRFWRWTLRINRFRILH